MRGCTTLRDKRQVDADRGKEKRDAGTKGGRREEEGEPEEG